jgi:hypothetical protein
MKTQFGRKFMAFGTSGSYERLCKVYSVAVNRFSAYHEVGGRVDTERFPWS